MGFGYWQRSPREVQRDNAGFYDFDKIKNKWENTKPIKGKKRGHLDIRPNGDRTRSWERIIKVSDEEFFLVNDAYPYSDVTPEHADKVPNRRLTFTKRNGIETITIHSPRVSWGDYRNKPMNERPLDRHGFNSPSTTFFYRYNLPLQGIDIEKYGRKAYLVIQNQDGTTSRYVLNNGDVIISRKVGDEYFKPEVVHREHKYKLDRTKTKEVRKEVEAFANYVVAMFPLLDIDKQDRTGWYTDDNPFDYAGHTEPNSWFSEEKKSVCGKTWQELVACEGDEVPAHWYSMLLCYKQRAKRERWNEETRKYEPVIASVKSIKNMIYRDVYKYAKPLAMEEVPLGTAFRNNSYANW